MCFSMQIKCIFRMGKGWGGRDHDDEHNADSQVHLEWEVSLVLHVDNAWVNTEQMFLPDREPGPLSQQQFCGSSEVHLPFLKGYLRSTLLRDFKAHFETTYIFMLIEQWLCLYFWVNIWKRKVISNIISLMVRTERPILYAAQVTAFGETGRYLSPGPHTRVPPCFHWWSLW